MVASTLAFLAAGLFGLSSAAPTGNPATDALEERAPTLPTVDYIVNHYMKNPSPARPCFFYNVPSTVLTRDQIIATAHSAYGLTLYDIYYKDTDLNSPFDRKRDPMKGLFLSGQERDWFRITSRAYATVCHGDAYLVWDGKQVFQNKDKWWTSIWSSDEFDAIIRGQTGIKDVYVVDPSNGKPTKDPVWKKGEPAPPNWHIPIPGAGSKRDLEARDGDIDWDHRFEHMFDEYGSFPEPTELQAREIDALEAREPTNGGIEQNPEQTVFSPGQSQGWVPGRCSFHFRQHAGLAPTTSFDIELYDEEQTNVIGGITNRRIDGYYAMPSRLQYTLVIHPGEHPKDPVNFSYAGFDFASNGGVCKTGAYDNGVRQGDCSFACTATP